LIGVTGWFDREPGSVTPETELLIEAARDGWWYSAPQPDGGLVVAYMTDRDLISASGRAGLMDEWRSKLSEAPQTHARVSSRGPTRTLNVHRAESGFSWPDRGPGWRVIGDAAFARDPLAGNGIANAIRSGVEAAGDLLREFRIAQSPREKPRQATSTPQDHASQYLAQRARYYGMEPRWPESLFWMRRQPIDLHNLEIFLHPERLLKRGVIRPAPREIAPVEALVPPGAVQSLLRQLVESPLPAHAAMQRLHDDTGGLEAIRLLAALQLLIRSGALKPVAEA
jgi:hypothetical protein